MPPIFSETWGNDFGGGLQRQRKNKKECKPGTRISLKKEAKTKKVKRKDEK